MSCQRDAAYRFAKKYSNCLANKALLEHSKEQYAAQSLGMLGASQGASAANTIPGMLLAAKPDFRIEEFSW